MPFLHKCIIYSLNHIMIHICMTAENTITFQNMEHKYKQGFHPRFLVTQDQNSKQIQILDQSCCYLVGPGIQQIPVIIIQTKRSQRFPFLLSSNGCYPIGLIYSEEHLSNGPFSSCSRKKISSQSSALQIPIFTGEVDSGRTHVGHIS